MMAEKLGVPAELMRSLSIAAEEGAWYIGIKSGQRAEGSLVDSRGAKLEFETFRPVVRLDSSERGF